MKEYTVVQNDTGLFSGSLDPVRLQNQLNKYAAQGWRFVRSIHETRRMLVLFRRECHFLVFERDRVNTPPIGA